MRAYSQDLREHVLRAVDEGKPREQIIAPFHVSRATIEAKGDDKSLLALSSPYRSLNLHAISALELLKKQYGRLME